MHPAIQIARADEAKFKQLVSREWNVDLLRAAHDLAAWEGNETRRREIVSRLNQVRGS